jgi:hypothetical protein
MMTLTLDAGIRQNAEQDRCIDVDEVAIDVADWDDVEEFQAPARGYIITDIRNNNITNTYIHP